MRLSRSAKLPAVIAVAALVAAVPAFLIVQVQRSASGIAVITPPESWQVLASVWPKRELARTNDDLQVLAAVDTGPELARDTSVTIEAHDSGRWSQRVQRPLGAYWTLVAFQSTFPASFLAIVQTSSQWSGSPARRTLEGRETAFLVFTKTSAAAPWRVAMETTSWGRIWSSDMRSILLEQQSVLGYVHPAPQPSWIRPASAIAMLASYYQHYADYGEAPSENAFLPGYLTTTQGEEIAAHGLNGQLNTQGFRAEVTYSADPSDPVYQFAAGHMNLTCGTVRGEVLDTPAGRGGYLYQPPDRTNWGGWLPPGAYSQLTESLMHQVCLLIAPTSLGGIRALTGDDRLSTLSVTGTPAVGNPAEAVPGQSQ